MDSARKSREGNFPPAKPLNYRAIGKLSLSEGSGLGHLPYASKTVSRSPAPISTARIGMSSTKPGFSA